MSDVPYYTDPSKCVRCGACKSLCPTYLSALDETMGARGRVAMLGALADNRLVPTKKLSDNIFSCMLCEACSDLCPAGLNIPEIIYKGRADLKDFYRRGRLFKQALTFSLTHINTTFYILRRMQRFLYPLLYRTGKLRY